MQLFLIKNEEVYFVSYLDLNLESNKQIETLKYMF